MHSRQVSTAVADIPQGVAEVFYQTLNTAVFLRADSAGDVAASLF